MARKTTLQPGEVLRGYVVALRLTADDVRYLEACQRELHLCWNLLVTSRETHLEHCLRRAEEDGMVEPAPERPEQDAPDEVWADYRKECGERKYRALRATLRLPGLGWDDWRVTYQQARTVVWEMTRGAGSWVSGVGSGSGSDPEPEPKTQDPKPSLRLRHPETSATAQMFSTLVQRFQRTKHARHKKLWRSMPLVNTTGGVAIDGLAGARETSADGTEIGTRLRLRGEDRRVTVRFGRRSLHALAHRLPDGPFLQGIALRREHDRWTASAKVRCLPVPRDPGEPGSVVGINLGLDCLYADSTGKIVRNPRGNGYSVRCARLARQADEAEDENERVDRQRQLGRYQERMARRTRHVLESEILPHLARFETIYLAVGLDGVQSAAQGRQARLSENELGGYVSAMGETRRAIVERYASRDAKGEVLPEGRVREVEWSWISQRCSQCGHHDAKAWKRDGFRGRHREIGTCPSPRCGAQLHVDVNAARNALDRPLISVLKTA